MSVYLTHARTEPHVWTKSEVIVVIVWQDTLEATVKQVHSVPSSLGLIVFTCVIYPIDHKTKLFLFPF